MDCGHPAYLLCRDGRREPRIDELLEDPVVAAVMASDRVGQEDLKDLMDTARLRLQARRMPRLP